MGLGQRVHAGLQLGRAPAHRRPPHRLAQPQPDDGLHRRADVDDRRPRLSDPGSVNAYTLAYNWGARPPTAGPLIGSLSPNPMMGSTAAQMLTIAGSGFLTGARVTASYTGYSAALTVTSLSAN